MARSAALALAACVLISLSPLLAGKTMPARIPVHAARQSESDLEVGGELAGMPAGATGYVSYRDLLRLPQVSYTVSDDSNFKGRTAIGGVPLDQLAQALGAPGSKLVVAICYDGYRTNYPQAYLAAHKPLLVLKIAGKSQANWPKSEYGGPLGPYLISHPFFKPSFQVLSHTDEPQIPFGVTRIEFRDEAVVLGSIAPPGTHAPNSPVMNGYRIAQQNCFRCHNMGAEGGQMAGRNWLVLSMWASTEPQFFSRYVKNPQSVDPKDRMPGNPQYDAATIDALRQYFASFDSTARKGAR